MLQLLLAMDLIVYPASSCSSRQFSSAALAYLKPAFHGFDVTLADLRHFRQRKAFQL